MVVTMTIPLVLALTFVVLDMMGITLQRISLGALIIALGLLVALRACRDPAAGDPSPWLALPLQATLRGLDANGQPMEHTVAIEALSEAGVALAPGALPPEIGRAHV